MPTSKGSHHLDPSLPQQPAAKPDTNMDAAVILSPNARHASKRNATLASAHSLSQLHPSVSHCSMTLDHVILPQPLTDTKKFYSSLDTQVSLVRAL